MRTRLRSIRVHREDRLPRPAGSGRARPTFFSITTRGNCGSPLQSDRHRLGAPMYRERHSKNCLTNGRSVVARKLDGQIEAILGSVRLKPRWRKRMAYLASGDRDGPDPEELHRRRRRISRTYADGAFTDDEYEHKLAELDALIQQAIAVELWCAGSGVRSKRTCLICQGQKLIAVAKCFDGLSSLCNDIAGRLKVLEVSVGRLAAGRALGEGDSGELTEEQKHRKLVESLKRMHRRNRRRRY